MIDESRDTPVRKKRTIEIIEEDTNDLCRCQCKEWMVGVGGVLHNNNPWSNLNLYGSKSDP